MRLKPIVLAFACTLLCGCAVEYSVAQPLPSLQENEMAGEVPQWRAVKLKYVRPSIMAWWIDEKNQPVPKEFVEAKKFQEQLEFSLGFSNEKQLLPRDVDREAREALVAPLDRKGITAIFAFDASNEVLALSDAATWKKLQDIIETLDKPVKLVEVKITVVEINSDDSELGAINAEFTNSGKAAFWKDTEFEEQIAKWKAGGKSRIIGVARLTAMNNFPSLTGSAEYTPANLRMGSDAKYSKVYFPLGYSADNFAIGMKFLFYVKPVVNKDNSGYVFFKIALPLYLMRKSGISKPFDLLGDEIFLETRAFMTTVSKIASGETMFLGDFVTQKPVQTLIQASDKKNDSYSTLFFVSAHVLNINQ